LGFETSDLGLAFGEQLLDPRFLSLELFGSPREIVVEACVLERECDLVGACHERLEVTFDETPPFETVVQVDRPENSAGARDGDRDDRRQPHRMHRGVVPKA